MDRSRTQAHRQNIHMISQTLSKMGLAVGEASVANVASAASVATSVASGVAAPTH